MLQSIRDHTQGWIAGIIISILILSFALWGIHSYIGGNGGNFVVAKVNGSEITKSQLAVAYERLRRQLQIQYSSNYSLPASAEANLKQQALQALINIQVFKQASFAQDYRISSRQIDYYLESMPEFQVNGQFSLPRFQQLLATTLYTANDFLGLINTNLLIEQPRLGIIFTAFSLPNEVSYDVALVSQERNIVYMTLPILKQDIVIPTEKVQAYYQQHQDEFKTPEQASIEYIEFSLKDLMDQIHPTEQALKNFYNENINTFTSAAQWKLESILLPLKNNPSEKEVKEISEQAKNLVSKLKAGQSVADLIAQHGGQADTKLQGWMTLNQVPAELQKPLLMLTKPGMMTNPVRVANGFIILKVVEIKEAVARPFAEVKEKAREALAHQQAEEKFLERKEKLANLTYEHPESLIYASKELGLPIKASDMFTKEKGGKDITTNTKIREAAFSNEVLTQQNNSDVIQLTSDSALVLRIKTHTPATLLDLKVVAKQVTDKLKEAEVNAKTAQLADDIKNQLQQGAVTPEQIAAQYHLTWNKIGYIGRHATKVDSAILVAAFSMPKPTDAVKITYASAKVPSGYVVIALNSVRDGSLGNQASQLNIFSEQIQNAQGLLEYELYKASLLAKAKIVIENQDKISDVNQEMS